MSPGREMSRAARAVLVSALMLVPVLAAFWQVGGHAFVNWDDNIYIYENLHVRGGLSAEGVSWAFRTTQSGHWHPLTWLSHMADVDLFGLRAGWHHRVNLLLHVINAVLLFLLLRSMTGAVWPSGFVAALFAVHPLHVESVAWVAERKDVLSTLFWFLTTAAYVRYARKGGAWRYAAVGLCFAMGLLSKPMLVTLPFTLLLLDWWPLGRVSAETFSPALLRRLVAEKVPLLALSVASSVVTYIVQARAAAPETAFSPLGSRISNAVVFYAAYLVKTVWPSGLAAVYPPPVFVPIPAWQVVPASLVLAGLSFAALRNWKRRPWLAVGWLWYVGTLAPVVGLVPAPLGEQLMADRFTYVPLIGIFVAIVWEVSERSLRLRLPRAAAGYAGAVAVAVLAGVSWVQAGYWKDSVTLYRRVLDVTRDNSLAHNNLGIVLADRGQGDEAIAHYREALRINPRYAEAYNNLGNALGAAGRFDEAIAQYGEALRLKPEFADPRNNLGSVLATRGRLDEAIAQYREALRLKPDFAEAHSNLGSMYAARGRFDEAVVQFREAVRIKPEIAEMHNNLGNALAAAGRLDEAIAQYRNALRIRPGMADAHNNLGSALLARGLVDEAVVQFREAIRLSPDFTEAHANLGNALAARGGAPGASTRK